MTFGGCYIIDDFDDLLYYSVLCVVNISRFSADGVYATHFTRHRHGTIQCNRQSYPAAIDPKNKHRKRYPRSSGATETRETLDSSAHEFEPSRGHKTERERLDLGPRPQQTAGRNFFAIVHIFTDSPR